MTKHLSPDKRRAQILDAARSCFLQKGYFATKMDEIAKNAGLSKGGVYFHFDSKREIFRALVQGEHAAAIEFIEQVESGPHDLMNKIASLGQHFTELFSTSNNPKLTLIIGEMALRDEEVRGLLVEIQETYVDRMTSMLERGIEQGQLREVDARSVAFLLKSMLDGIQLAYAMGQVVDLDKTLASGMDLVMRGVMSSSAEA